MKKITLFALLLLAAGCYPGGIDSYEETDTVVTVRNPEADYSANRTFSLSTEVVDLCDYVPDLPPQEGEVTEPPDCSDGEEINHTFDASILETVKDNMVALGYTKVDASDDPDVGIFVAGARREVSVTYYYDYWYSYWGYYPGWSSCWDCGWYYPGVPVTATYDVGSLLITMVKSVPGGSPADLPVYWTAAINGLLGSDVATSQARIETTIGQAFEQSPYLRVN